MVPAGTTSSVVFVAQRDDWSPDNEANWTKLGTFCTDAQCGDGFFDTSCSNSSSAEGEGEGEVVCVACNRCTAGKYLHANCSACEDTVCRSCAAGQYTANQNAVSGEL